MLTPAAGATRNENGFTLIEMLVSITLLGVIFSTLSLVMVGSMRVNKETRARLDATRDEQFVAAYFASDMAGARQVIAGGSSACGTGAAVVTILGESFVPTASADAAIPSSTTTVASYIFDAGALTRQYCESAGNPPFATPTETVSLAQRLSTTPTVTCFDGAAASACSSTTTRVSVTFTRLDGAPFTLSGTRRATP